MAAFAAAVALEDDHAERQQTLGWIVGLGTGWAVVSEFPALVPAVLIVGLALWTLRDRWPRSPSGGLRASGRRRRARRRRAPRLQRARFRIPVASGLCERGGLRADAPGRFRHHVSDVAPPVRDSVRQLSRPAADCAAGGVDAGRAVRSGARQPARRRAIVVAAVSGVFYLLLNASYFYWEGGWAYGPRQMMAGAAVPRARPGAALGRMAARRARRADRRLDLGRRADARRRVDDAAAASDLQGAGAGAAVAGVSRTAISRSTRRPSFTTARTSAGFAAASAAARGVEPRRDRGAARVCASLLPLALVWVIAAAVSAGRAGTMPADGPRQFGNREANLRFLDATGVSRRRVRRDSRDRHRHRRDAARR